ncbi:MAG: thermonuclease family protein [Thiohalorhabdus sp.]|uniref:thermonuclease family protein n=1 Tax=Thiohalorhabdus sp. TaxID=3094134 RepID=UPI003980076D
MLGLLPAPGAPAGEAYRWEDADGTVHYGDRPPPQAERIPGTGSDPDDSGELRSVERVLDGDTLELADGTRVRLIGLNAPEVAHGGDPAQRGGPEARRFLRDLLEGRRVRLKQGAEKTDRYDRLLAHVLTPDGTSVNASLLRRGHAHATVHPPNLSRVTEYFAAEREAQRAGRGIWALSRYRIQAAERARDLRNSFRRIRGRVKTVDRARKYVYLRFAEDFVAILRKDREDAFADAGKASGALQGRTVVVRGWVRLHEGTPAVRLHHPEQIEAVR